MDSPNQEARPRFVGTAPWLVCRDLRATVGYYRQTLGFTGEWHWLWGDPPDHAGVSRGKCRVLLVENSARETQANGSEVVFYVQSVSNLYEELVSAGAEVAQELAARPWGTVDFTVLDPNGYRLIFTEAPDEWGTQE